MTSLARGSSWGLRSVHSQLCPYLGWSLWSKVAYLHRSWPCFYNKMGSLPVCESRWRLLRHLERLEQSDARLVCLLCQKLQSKWFWVFQMCLGPILLVEIASLVTPSTFALHLFQELLLYFPPQSLRIRRMSLPLLPEPLLKRLAVSLLWLAAAERVEPVLLQWFL